MDNIKEQEIFDFNFKILENYLAFLPKSISVPIDDLQCCISSLQHGDKKNPKYLMCFDLVVEKFIAALYKDVLNEKKSDIRKEDYVSYLIDMERQVKNIRISKDMYIFLSSTIHSLKNVVRTIRCSDFNFTKEVVYAVMSSLVLACMYYKKYYVRKNDIDVDHFIKKRKLEIEEKNFEREIKKFKQEKEELEKKKLKQDKEFETIKKKAEELEMKLKAEEKRAQALEFEMLQKKKQALEIKLRSQKELDQSRTRLEIPLSPEYDNFQQVI